MGLEGKKFSHYRILRLIGKGGMGEVYLVEDLHVQRQVAVKFIKTETIQSDPEAVKRDFWREATAIAHLDHPSILPLYEHGQETFDGKQVPYLIMPYRPEGSLKAWIGKQAPQRLTLQQIAHLMQQAGQSLQYAHDHQIMHLDVKPENFLVRSEPKTNDYPDLLLSDFGIARLANATTPYSQHGVGPGTRSYMAPEQWEDQPTFASDQYALAIMAYELLIGSPPFQGTEMSVMFAHMQKRPLSVCDRNPLVPPTVDRVVQRALAKKPEERFSSVSKFAQAFQDAVQTAHSASTVPPVLVPPSPSPDRVVALPNPIAPTIPAVRRLPRQRSRLFLPTILLVVLLGGLGGASLIYRVVTSVATGTGISWETRQLPPLGFNVALFGVTWGNQQYVVVGDKGTIQTHSVADILKGITFWAAQQSSTSDDLYGVTWGDQQYVVVGDKGTILTSTSS